MDDRGRFRAQRRQDNFQRTLRVHGIVDAAWEAVLESGQNLVDLTRREGREFAVTIEIETGRHVGAILRGDVDQIDLSAYLAALATGHRYLHLHTHPGDAAPSDTDVGLLLQHAELVHLIVAASDGTVYVVSKRDGHTPALTLAAVIEWNQAYGALFERYREAVRSSHLTEREAGKQHTHQVMRVVSRRFRLRYSRRRGAFS